MTEQIIDISVREKAVLRHLVVERIVKLRRDIDEGVRTSDDLRVSEEIDQLDVLRRKLNP